VLCGRHRRVYRPDCQPDRSSYRTFRRSREKGTTAFDISGRCGVFAKTDLQTPAHMGVSKEDLVLRCSTPLPSRPLRVWARHAAWRARGVPGGAVQVQPQARCGVRKHLALQRRNPFAAVSAGHGGDRRGARNRDQRRVTPALPGKESSVRAVGSESRHCEDAVPALRFSRRPGGDAFRARHAVPRLSRGLWRREANTNVYIGIDAGSTTTKCVLVDNAATHQQVYASNSGDPLGVVRKAYLTYTIATAAATSGST